MIAHEFTSSIGSDGRLLIPDPVRDMPAGSPVRVIILMDEKDLPAHHKQMPTDKLSSLEETIREIKSSPQHLGNIRPASSDLAKHLGNSGEESDPCFNPAEWNREWDRLEAEMKAEELADQKAEEELHD